MPERVLRVDPRDRPGYSSRYAPRRPPPARPSSRPPRRRGRRALLGRLARLGRLLLLWCASLGRGVLAYFAFTLPDTSQRGIGDRRPRRTTLAQHGSPLGPLRDPS